MRNNIITKKCFVAIMLFIMILLSFTITYAANKWPLRFAAVTISDWDYGATPSNPIVTGNTGGGNVTYEYKVRDADDSTYTQTVPTEVGKYTIRATIAETKRYEGKTVTNNFEIRKKDIYISKITIDDMYYNEDGIIPLENIHVYFINNQNVEFTSSAKFSNLSHKYVGVIDKGVIVTITLTDECFKNYGFGLAREQTTTYLSTVEVKSITPTITVPEKSTNQNTTTLELIKGESLNTAQLVSIDPSLLTSGLIYTLNSNGIQGVTMKGTVLYADETAGTGTVAIKITSPAKDVGGILRRPEYNEVEKTIYIKIVEKTYTITTNVNGGNGTITDSDKVVEGEDFEVTFTPSEGYEISKVTVNDKDVTSDVANNKLILTKVTEDKKVIVTYSQIPVYYYITTSVNEGNGTITDSDEVVEGEDFEVTFTPSEGYEISKVTVNGQDVTSDVVNNKLTLTEISENKEIIVSYSEIKDDEEEDNNKKTNEEDNDEEDDKSSDEDNDDNNGNNEENNRKGNSNNEKINNNQNKDERNTVSESDDEEKLEETILKTVVEETIPVTGDELISKITMLILGIITMAISVRVNKNTAND